MGIPQAEDSNHPIPNTDNIHSSLIDRLLMVSSSMAHGAGLAGAQASKTGSIGPKNPKKPENPGFNNYGIFWQFYGDFRFK